ncbi:MAG: type II secretion system protein GspC, partial [Steroidobacteraceae bacterium]
MPALALNLRTLRDQSPEQWLQTLVRVGPGLVGAILVVALAWQLVQATWLFLGATDGGQPPASNAGQPQRAAASAAVDLNALVGAHLFGVASSEPSAADVNAAPQTQMNLVLTGTMASADPQKGYAIVGESATTAKTYPTGATLRPGTKLHSVFTDRVILDNGGRLETLVLPRQFAGTAAPVRPPVAAAGNGVGDQLRQIAESNPSAFTSVVRPQPVFANGVQRGYRVYPGRDRKQFANLGLQPGDLVTSVNGTPLDDPSRGMEIFNSLNSAAQVSVTVERNGQSQQLSLNTAQLSLPQPAQA